MGAHGHYIGIHLVGQNTEASPIPQIEAVFKQYVATGDLRRVDKRGGTLEATYWVDMTDSTKLSEMISALESAFPGIGITFIDQQRVPAI